jgi:D-alanyl-D-alanine carboxypeptidase
MKRFFSVLLSLIMFAVGIPVFAQEKESPVEIKAKSAVLMDVSTGQVL